MEVVRRKFQGVLNILSFNIHFYIIGLIVLVVLIGSQFLLKWPNGLFLGVLLLFLYGFIMPLIVSIYVYDFSKYYTLSWLDSIIRFKPKNIVNINAGFDETSFIIKRKFPNASLKVFDFYNVKEHTEAAIVRARKVTMEYPNTQEIKTSYIPLENASVDVVFLLSAAHEIRKESEKVQFLKECYRICKPEGKIIMVEHLRDFPNFLAFSIGFTHFFSRKVWEKVFQKAGFNSVSEVKFTPFMSVFSCNP